MRTAERVEYRVSWRHEKWGPNTSPKTKTYARKRDSARQAWLLFQDGCLVTVDYRTVGSWQPLNANAFVSGEVSDVRRRRRGVPQGDRAHDPAEPAWRPSWMIAARSRRSGPWS
jgi:hypothetical protein